MLPLIEPGQNVLVYLNEDDVREGDVVAVRAPYYTLEGEGSIIFRRVEEIDDKGMTLVYDAEMTTDEKLFLSKKELVGKVILLDK